MRIWLSLGILMATSLGAYAGAADVPEIDAFSGLAAMGVIGSIAALVWERRTDNTHCSQSRKGVDLRDRSHRLCVSPYRCSQKHSDCDPNSHVSPLMRLPNALPRLKD